MNSCEYTVDSHQTRVGILMFAPMLRSSLPPVVLRSDQDTWSRFYRAGFVEPIYATPPLASSYFTVYRIYLVYRLWVVEEEDFALRSCEIDDADAFDAVLDICRVISKHQCVYVCYRTIGCMRYLRRSTVKVRKEEATVGWFKVSSGPCARLDLI